MKKYLICIFENTLHEIEEEKVGYKNSFKNAEKYIRERLNDQDSLNPLTEYFNVNEKGTLDRFFTDGRVTYGIYEIEELDE